MIIKDIYNHLDKIAPFETSAEWDNCGLSVGFLNGNVTKVLIALDVTSKVIDEAVDFGAELVITHHPLIFSPISSVTDDSLVYKAVISGITFISSHTCLDKAVGGVNHCLADKVGIRNLADCPEDEFLKVGEVDSVSASAFADAVKNALGGKVSYTDSGKAINKIAVCSGSGGDLVSAAFLAGADALLTGEAKHHEFLEAERLGISLICAGHYETEVIVCDYIKDTLEMEFKDIEIKVSETPSPIKYK